MNEQVPTQQYYQPSFVYVQPQDGQQMYPQPVFQLPPQQYVDQQQQQPAQSSQGFYPQIPVQQPQYIFAENATAPITEERTRWQRKCKRFNAYKIGSAITLISFIGYFFVTPQAFPWFLVIAAISAGAMSAKYIRDNYSNDQPRFRKHAAWFGSINIAFLLVNLWSGGFPWSAVPIAIWGAILAMHAESVYNQDRLKKNLWRHIIIYLAVGLIVLVCTSYVPDFFGPQKFNRMRRPEEGKEQTSFPERKQFEAQPQFEGHRRFGMHPHHMWRRGPGGQEGHHGRRGGKGGDHQGRPTGSAAPVVDGTTNAPKRPESQRPERPESQKPQRPESQKPEQKEGNKGQQEGEGRHHGKGSKKPETSKKPSDEPVDQEWEMKKEYARESARHDTQSRFIMRSIGFGIMFVWTLVLLVHAIKTKRAVKLRKLQMRQQMANQQQPVELQSVDVMQQPNVVVTHTTTGQIQN